MSQDALKKEIWIFGSGTFALDAYHAAICGGLSVVGIIDHGSADFKLFQKEPVKTYNLSDNVLLNRLPVYFAICNPYAHLPNLVNKVAACEGYTSSHSPVELCRLLAEKGQHLQQYWLTTNFDLQNEFTNEISLFLDLLSDVKSKELYARILAYRSSGGMDLLPIGEGVQFQYLPSDLATPPRILDMIELGSCGGENLKSFLDSGYKFKSGYALEPDLHNYEVLIGTLQKLDISNLHPVPLAAWSSEEKLRFESQAGTNSSITEGGSDFVQAVSLDKLIPKDYSINYIKMDIEGAELNALQGSHRIIEAFTPHLAICVYHKPADLWEIGLWIHQNFSGRYSFHIRTYAEQSFETVLYCIPV
jgi:FkbM family methyltransferase